MYQYFFQLRGRLEFYEAITWYGENSSQAADKFIEEVTNKLQEICQRPTLYRNTKNHFREALLKSYPYTIIYRIDEEKKLIIVISVFHHSRNPGNKFK